MALFERGAVFINYEEYGTGFPLLLLAPGGMRSKIDFWSTAPFNPIKEFAHDFRVIAMDQRNAGNSTAPITTLDSWGDYTRDQLALLEHLEIQQAHIMGGCIGSSYCLGLIEADPQRIAAAVLQNPIGLSNGNRESFISMFDEWGVELKQSHPALTDETLESFRQNMFGGEFVFNVSREFVQGCPKPLLVLAGNDQFHPTATAQEITDLAPNAELVLKWREPEVVKETIEKVRAFLKANTP